MATSMMTKAIKRSCIELLVETGKRTKKFMMRLVMIEAVESYQVKFFKEADGLALFNIEDEYIRDILVRKD
ncbi:hypothetical protein HPP92_012080 [Vanilla planifolia]|uniref:Uncharacterized protein n=1 Tax=Vanilla planifolia TaxID=51239 RepID=A0A835V0T4_VANPL|nr:hypothetical protein HPP92_012080 [Vanilla planifolia]